MSPRAGVMGWVAAGVMALAACQPSKPDLAQRLWSDRFEFRITADELPPHALDRVLYTVFVRDAKTHEPIASGQGRIFATNADGKTIWDGFTYGPEVGTYHATLMFLTAGEWAMNVQFRRDSTSALQKPEYDWRQLILPATAPGSARRDSAAAKP